MHTQIMNVIIVLNTKSGSDGMMIWFKGKNSIQCSIEDVRHAIERLGRKILVKQFLTQTSYVLKRR